MLSFLQLSYGAVAVNAFDLVNCQTLLGQISFIKAAISNLLRRFTWICSWHILGNDNGVYNWFSNCKLFSCKQNFSRAKRPPSTKIVCTFILDQKRFEKRILFFSGNSPNYIRLPCWFCSIFTGNESRSGRWGLTLLCSWVSRLLILYLKPYRKSGGWIVSSLISACLVAVLVSLLSFVAWLTFDYRLFEYPELFNSLEWVTLFSFMGYFTFNWWRFKLMFCFQTIHVENAWRSLTPTTSLGTPCA